MFIFMSRASQQYRKFNLVTVFAVIAAVPHLQAQTSQVTQDPAGQPATTQAQGKTDAPDLVSSHKQSQKESQTETQTQSETQTETPTDIETEVQAQIQPRVLAVKKAMRMDSAEESLDNATRQVLDLISAGQTYAKDDPERFFIEVEAVLAPMLDFPRFTRNVMGPVFKKATETQYSEFSDTFKWSLVRTYALALTEFHDGEVEVLPPRRAPKNPNKANVVQEVTMGGKTYVAVYRMQRNKNNAWRVTNIILEGINLGLNFRSQFAQAYRKAATAQKGADESVAIDQVIQSWGA